MTFRPLTLTGYTSRLSVKVVDGVWSVSGLREVFVAPFLMIQRPSCVMVNDSANLQYFRPPTGGFRPLILQEHF